ncbi:hypothetical protein [Solirubrobacter soli]|uniref:hypothetical protein n=1 Tax=Solirubrobacter soli TaxID=363832 RepID=UPI0003FE772F|nr:hypothetical protein [Solirubrobacter soli]
MNRFFSTRASALLIALAALGVGVASAHAEVRDQPPSASDHTAGGSSGGCGWPVWTKQPRIVIHTTQFNAGGAKPDDEGKMVNAIQQVANEFSDTPDLSARITSVTTTTDPYYWDTWVNDSVPTIHVRFSPRSAVTEDNDGEGADGLTKARIDSSNCTISEAHIEFPWPADKTWNYLTPDPDETPGERWYDTAPTYQGTWFRPTFLHELLHAFGFKHVKGVYSFMNHRSPGGFPWAGGKDNGVRMLPWEVGTLRNAYGDVGTSYAVGLRNTWYAAPQPGDDASSQVALCPDSSTWDEDANACKTSSTSGDRRICSGDRVTGSVAFANYSTTGVRATVQLYFSKDEIWDPGDTPSTTTFTEDAGAEASVKMGGSFAVPTLTAGPQFAIARVTAVPLLLGGATDPSQTQHDSIPLRIPVGAAHGYDSPGFHDCTIPSFDSSVG